MTRRERGCRSKLIGKGLSSKEIAKRLNIASHTVKSHVRNVMEKLALHSRLQIAAYSHRQENALAFRSSGAAPHERSNHSFMRLGDGVTTPLAPKLRAMPRVQKSAGAFRADPNP